MNKWSVLLDYDPKCTFYPKRTSKGKIYFYLRYYLVNPKIVIKIYNISTLHKNMYVLKYSILNSFAQNPAISTFFRKVHSDEREFAG